MFYIDKILIALLILKIITGYHFPWEKCECCGKRLGKNHKPTKLTNLNIEDYLVDCNFMNQIEKENDKLIDDLP